MKTGTENSVSKLRILLCLCVVKKSTANVETKALSMRHQSQKGFRGFFVEIPQHQKGYIIYVPSTRRIVSSHEVVFDKNKYSTLAYTSRPYSEALDMQQ